VAPESSLFADGIKANLEALVAMGEMTAAPSTDLFIDASFLSQASQQVPPP